MFGIRTQAVLLTVVPALGLLATVFVSSLSIERTNDLSQRTQQLAAVVQLSDKMMQELGAATRGAALYVHDHTPADLAAYRNARAGYAVDEPSFRRLIATFPSLRAAGGVYASKVNSGMEIIASYLAAYRAGGRPTADRFARTPAAREYGPQLQRVQLQFDQAVQSRTLLQASLSRYSMRGIETGLALCAAFALALSLVASLLFGMRTARRLGRLGENARRLASGAPALSVQGGDEIAELDVLYREMAANIETYARAHEAALVELREERDTIALLQQSLLPELPQVPGLQIASSYATPGAGAQIGGDWFDVFVLPDGRVGLSVGDVAGHGVAAATVMGFVRQAIRIVSWREPNPAAVMRSVNELLCHDNRNMIVTAFFAVYDLQSRRLTYTTAGHPPPMVASSNGDVILLPGDGFLLGVDERAALASHEHRLRSGDALILYTDGLVELERDYFKGMQDLESAVRAEILGPSVNPAEGIQRRVFAQVAPRDDAAVLVMTVPVAERIPKLDAPIYVREFDARLPEAGRDAKRELLAALASLGTRTPDPIVAEIVFGELLANVVQHTPGLMHVSLASAEDGVILTVRDRGRTLPASNGRSDTRPPPTDVETGRGLFIIRTLSPRVAISVTDEWRVTSVVLPHASDDRSDHQTLDSIEAFI